MPASCTTINLLKQGNFLISMRDDLQNIEFMVQEAVLPGLTLGEIVLGHASQQQHRPGDNITWNVLSLQCLTDEKLLAFKQAVQFITKTKNPATGVMQNTTQPFDAQLSILTNKNNIGVRVKFYNAWIMSVGDVQLTQSSTEDETPVFNIEVQYDFYEFLD